VDGIQRGESLCTLPRYSGWDIGISERPTPLGTYIGADLCRILDMNFGEFFFQRLSKKS
jgi:hypothetical protein